VGSDGEQNFVAYVSSNPKNHYNMNYHAKDNHIETLIYLCTQNLHVKAIPKGCSRPEISFPKESSKFSCFSMNHTT